MNDTHIQRIAALLSGGAMVTEALLYMGEMLVADKAANQGEHSQDGNELEGLINLWATIEGTKVMCDPNPKSAQLHTYCQDLFADMVACSDRLAALYDAD